MKRFAAFLSLLGALVAATQAHAEEVRAVSVVGVAQLAISPGAGQGEAYAVYRQAMAAAITDGREKAEFLASKTERKITEIHSIGEAGGSISCTNPEGEYAEYTGAQPDFGSSGSGLVAAPSAPTVAHRTSAVAGKKKKKRKKKKRATAGRATVGATAEKAAVAVGCTLSTQVSLVYLLEA